MPRPFSEHGKEIATATRELVGRGAMEPVRRSRVDQSLWVACDHASCAENRLGDTTDPRAADETLLARWRAEAADEPLPPPVKRIYERCFWILDRGERCGTVALARSTLGGDLVRLASLYVFPTERGRGLGRAILGRIRAALARHGLGIRLETNWTWQKVARWYLRVGLWLGHWKRSLNYRWYPDVPAPIIAVGDREATFSVEHDGRPIVLVRARRDGDRLILDDTAPPEPFAELRWDALTTLSLALAFRGWPLIRSKEQWDKSYWADACAPEALAYQISVWEAWAHKRGWLVDTPRVPGLEYPSWETFQERWKAELSRVMPPDAD
ncbi:MAG: GNAT family N-acetyltransferase [Deltaproteobacteria bacterium]|nr:GNAT family N-acetyltransferase [Deltaproteobacteria bacterium]